MHHTMKRTALSLILVAACVTTMAQEEKQVTVIKPGTVEMKAENERPGGVIIMSPATASGDFDVPPAHPECAGEEGQDRLECTSDQIFALVKEKVGEPTLDMGEWGTSPVNINFSINQFGEVKDIRVEHSNDTGLQRKVIIALYELPKFNAATKGGKPVTSSMQVNYTYEELFK
jgi:hypothetical protein